MTETDTHAVCLPASSRRLQQTTGAGGLSAPDTRSVLVNSHKLALTRRTPAKSREQMLSANKTRLQTLVSLAPRRSLPLTRLWPCLFTPFLSFCFLSPVSRRSSCLDSLSSQISVKFPRVLVMFVSSAVPSKLQEPYSWTPSVLAHV